MIYFIQGKAETPVKIGFTASEAGPAKRIKALQTGYPYTLRVLASAEGAMRHESQIHDLLRADHLRGEWFEWSQYVGLMVRLVQGAAIDAALELFKLEASVLQNIATSETICAFETSLTDIFKGIDSRTFMEARRAGMGPQFYERALANGDVRRFYIVSDVRRWLADLGFAVQEDHRWLRRIGFQFANQAERCRGPVRPQEHA